MALTESWGSKSYKVSDRMLRVVGNLGRSTSTTSAREVLWWDEVRPIRADWAESMEASLENLAVLPDGWDGEGAQGVSPAASSKARRLLAHVAVDGVPSPFLSPTTDGGVLFEWRSPGSTVIVEVDAVGEESAFFEHRPSGYSWEGPLAASPDDLEKWLWALKYDDAF